MRFRKLRIAWSVAWGVVTVLLVACWVSSYFWFESSISVSGSIVSMKGILFLNFFDEWTLNFPWDVEWFPDGGSARVWPDAGNEISRWQGIGFIRGQCFSVEVQYWLLTALSIGTAVAPWRSWRFSLRTLLIATTLVAAALGLIVWMSQAG